MQAHILTPLDALLFDMDGTLVETIEAVESCWAAWAKDHKADLKHILRICHGRQSRDTIAQVAPHLDVAEAAADLLRRELAFEGGVNAIAGAKKFLQALSADDCPVAWTVVTSAPRPLAEHRLKLAGLPFPKHLVAAEDVDHGKPAPDCFLLGAERLGAAPRRTLVLEDSLAGLESGRRAGMQTLQICATHPPYDEASPLRVRDYRGVRIQSGAGRDFALALDLLG